MRIALITPTSSDPAHRRVSRSLAAAYRRLGHHVVRFPSGAKAASKEIKAAVCRSDFDLLHVHFFSRGLAGLSGTADRIRSRLLLTHQGACVRLMERPDVFESLAEKACAVTTVSDADRGELERAFPRLAAKMKTLHNGVDLPVRSFPSPDPPRPFILTVGRLAAYKGLDILTMAFAKLAGKIPELDWVACGPDQTGGKLGRFIRKLTLTKRVRLLGAVSPKRVTGLMRTCRLFALPSRTENHPMALLEAMAAGKPVVASRVGGVPETLTHGAEGLLVPPEDPQALAAALRRLHVDKGLRRRMGKAAKLRAAEFSWDRAAQAVLKMMESRR